jgi:hypothetical protein
MSLPHGLRPGSPSPGGVAESHRGHDRSSRRVRHAGPPRPRRERHAGAGRGRVGARTAPNHGRLVACYTATSSGPSVLSAPLIFAVRQGEPPGHGQALDEYEAEADRYEADRARWRRLIREAEGRAEQEAQVAGNRACACTGIAAEYEGWNGTLHAFWFANPDFAELFRAANAGKVVG